MIYYILPQTSTWIILLKNTSTNRHVESANLIYIALVVPLRSGEGSQERVRGDEGCVYTGGIHRIDIREYLELLVRRWG